MPVSIPSIFRRKKEDTLVLILASASTECSDGDTCLGCWGMYSPVGYMGSNIVDSFVESVIEYSFVESVIGYSFVESVTEYGTCSGSWSVVSLYGW